MQDLVERPWFRRMWTLQELFMANEPIVVCGTKSLRWNDLRVGIISWGKIPENWRNPVFTDTLSSVGTAHSFWLGRYQKYLDTELNTRNWIRGDGRKALAWHRLLDILESRNMLVGRAQDGLMIASIAVRFLLGQRYHSSVFLLFVILTRIVTMLITPSHAVPARGTRLPWEINLRTMLAGTMNLIRNREAKQPADKVFALYGLFQDLGIPLERPDYSKSVGQVYLEFTCALIQWHECLEMLKEVSGPSLLGLPTWVPDWNRRHDRILRGEKKAAGDSAPSFEIVSNAYNDAGVSGYNKYELKWTPNVASRNPGDMPKIVTKGLVEDEIAFCLPPLQEDKGRGPVQDDKSDEPLLYNIAIMLHWLSISQQPRFHVDPSPSSVLGTLFSIMHSEVWEHSDHHFQLRELFPDWLVLLNNHLRSLSSTEIPDSSAARSCAQDLKVNERLYSYHLERCDAIAGKRIFFTTKKERLGTGPPSMREGDVVALLAGLNAPIVLRLGEAGVGFEVVGVAYVEGIMHGEAWTVNEGDVGELVLI